MKNNNYLFLFVLIALIYGRTLSFAFTTLDEQWMILKNSSFLTNWSSIGESFKKPITDNYYRPILMVSFITDYHLGKLSPLVYHLTNVLLHILCVIILYKFLFKITSNAQKSFVLSMFFAIHPITLHAVAWIPGRNDELLFLFSILSVYHFLDFINKKQKLSFFYASVCFLAALFTKENSIVLFPILLFMLFSSDIKQIRTKIFLSSILLIPALVYYYFRTAAIKTSTSITAVSGESLKGILFSIASAFGKTVLPIHQSVFPKSDMVTALIGIVVLGLIAFIYYRTKIANKNMANLGLLILFLFLVVPISFAELELNGVQYEHRLYTPLAGMLVFLSQVKYEFAKEKLWLVYSLLVLFATKTLARSAVYKNENNFIEAGLKERPDVYLFAEQKAEQLFKKHEYQSALDFYSKSIALRPDKAELYCNRGATNFKLGNYNQAQQDFTRAISIGPVKPEYLINRCKIYLKLRNREKAREDFERLVSCCQETIPPTVIEDLRTQIQK